MLHTVGAVGAAYGAYVGLLNLLVKVAIVLSVACSLDRVVHVLLYAKFKAKAFLTGRRPEDEFSCRPLPDPAAYALVYPKVAVQLPMFNERAVCQAIIDSACEMAWPASDGADNWKSIRISAITTRTKSQSRSLR